jgi:Zn-dependent protease with chaperone function
MKSLAGNLFDGQRPLPLKAKIYFTEQNATVETLTHSAHYSIDQLIVSPRIASADRFITFPDGTQFVCADQSFLDSLPQESPSEGIVAWLENRWKVAVAGVVIIVFALFSGYVFGLPALAKRLAEFIPMEKEQVLGGQVLAWFDEKEWLMPSQIETSTQETIQGGFDTLCAELPFQEYYRLTFRSSRVFGPNAFALPGAVIVVTDDLIETSQNTEEVLAVLAHEIGHVELRHAMRSLMQNSLIAAAVAAITADAATLSVAVSGLPVVLAQTKYSRKFETAADDYGFALLKQNGYSPEAFASIMEKLSAKDGKGTAGFNYLSTHPVTEERIRRAYEAARYFDSHVPSNR